MSVKKLLLGAIRFYRKNISPTRPPCCRFVPTCSQYALEAVEKYGAVKGGWLAVGCCGATPFTARSLSSMTRFREMRCAGGTPLFLKST